MTQSENDRELSLVALISTDDAENDAIDFNPARLDLEAREPEL